LRWDCLLLQHQQQSLNVGRRKRLADAFAALMRSVAATAILNTALQSAFVVEYKTQIMTAGFQSNMEHATRSGLITPHGTIRTSV
jgi:hypothetical protein